MSSYCKLNLKFYYVWKFSFSAYDYARIETQITHRHTHACICTLKSGQREGVGGSNYEKLKKIMSQVVSFAKSLVEKYIHACINRFIQTCMHVCQENFPTTKLFSELRD